MLRFKNKKNQDDEYTRITRDDYILTYVRLPDFNRNVKNWTTDQVISFFDHFSNEVYKTRKKNHSWGYRVIEPQILHYGSTIILSSRLFKKQNLIDLNALTVKLFIEHCNIMVSSALMEEIPLKGIISIGEMVSGRIKSKDPEYTSQKDPLILKDFLEVFPLSEMFPDEFREGIIPPYDFPVFFGEPLSEAEELCNEIESIGIFMPYQFQEEVATEISILSDMLVEINLNKERFFACNWKNWTREHFGEEKIQSILDVANEDHSWTSFVEYSKLIS